MVAFAHIAMISLVILLPIALVALLVAYWMKSRRSRGPCISRCGRPRAGLRQRRSLSRVGIVPSPAFCVRRGFARGVESGPNGRGAVCGFVRSCGRGRVCGVDAVFELQLDFALC